MIHGPKPSIGPPVQVYGWVLIQPGAALARTSSLVGWPRMSPRSQAGMAATTQPLRFGSPVTALTQPALPGSALDATLGSNTMIHISELLTPLRKAESTNCPD